MTNNHVILRLQTQHERDASSILNYILYNYIGKYIIHLTNQIHQKIMNHFSLQYNTMALYFMNMLEKGDNNYNTMGNSKKKKDNGILLPKLF